MKSYDFSYSRLPSMTVPAEHLLPEAVSFAARKHQGQLRKDSRTPYFAHPVRVMLIVRERWGITDPEVLAAAVLHVAHRGDHDGLVFRL